MPSPHGSIVARVVCVARFESVETTAVGARDVVVAGPGLPLVVVPAAPP
jgi:hypothetical protein